MQIVSNGGNLHEMLNLFSWKNKKNIISCSSSELAQRVVKVKTIISKLIQTYVIDLFYFFSYMEYIRGNML